MILKSTRIFGIWILAFLAFNVLGKKVTDKIKVVNFNRPSWAYLTKFQLNIGTGSYKFRIKLETAMEESQNPPEGIPIWLHGFYDKYWHEVMKLEDCDKRVQLANINLNVNMPSNGEWSEWKYGKISQARRPHIWYFVLSDCDKFLPRITDQKMRFVYEIEILNSNGSQLSGADVK